MIRSQVRSSVAWSPAGIGLGTWLLCLAQAFGQPPGYSGGLPRFDPKEIIDRLDDNHNGQVDPDEMNGRSRYFLESLARDNNLDLSKPIPNNKLHDLLKARFGGGSSGSASNRSSGSSSATASAPQAFGVSTSTTTKVQGFGAASGIESWDAIRKNYDERVVERVEESMKRYDRDNDGLLNAEELKGGDWRSGNPLDFDKNRDGKVSRGEMAERYKARYSSGDYGRGGPPSYGGPPGSYSGGPPSGSYGYRGPPPGSSTTVVMSATSGSSPSPGTSSGSSNSRPGSSSSGGASPSGSSSNSGDDRVARYAEGLLKQYDTNKDGILQRDEWSKMRGEPQKADRDGNGLVTKDELAAQLADYSKGRSGGSSGSSGGGSSGESSSSRSSTGSSYPSSGSYGSRSSSSGSPAARGTVKTYRFLSPLERLPQGLPDWFTRNDADGDGQIAMAEFATSWDDERAAEFSRWDRNNDGLITAKEAAGK